MPPRRTPVRGFKKLKDVYSAYDVAPVYNENDGSYAGEFQDYSEYYDIAEEQFRDNGKVYATLENGLWVQVPESRWDNEYEDVVRSRKAKRGTVAKGQQVKLPNGQRGTVIELRGGQALVEVKASRATFNVDDEVRLDPIDAGEDWMSQYAGQTGYVTALAGNYVTVEFKDGFEVEVSGEVAQRNFELTGFTRRTPTRNYPELVGSTWQVAERFQTEDGFTFPVGETYTITAVNKAYPVAQILEDEPNDEEMEYEYLGSTTEYENIMVMDAELQQYFNKM